MVRAGGCPALLSSRDVQGSAESELSSAPRLAEVVVLYVLVCLPSVSTPSSQGQTGSSCSAPPPADTRCRTRQVVLLRVLNERVQ